MKLKWGFGQTVDIKGEWVNDSMSRKPETTTYVRTGAVFSMSSQMLELTMQELARYRDARVEGCCFWYGSKTDSDAVTVTHVVFPKQINNRQNFTVPSEAIGEMSAATRPMNIINRAQIHTHPSRWVGHSPYDDDHAISRNALSIVLPRYGATVDAWPKGVGVHEFQNGAWHRLSSRQTSQRIRIVESEVILIDLR
jgi:hypothetical protein